MEEVLKRTISTKSNANNNIRNVEVFVKFLSIGEIDTMNEKYHAELLIESKWLEDSQIIEYDPKINWNPKLYIENALPDVRENISYSISRYFDNTFVTETRYLKGSFWERLELQKFPLDIQELSVTIATKFHRSEVNLISNSVKKSSLDTEALNTFRDQQKLYELVKISETASYDLMNSNSRSLKIKFPKDRKQSIVEKTCQSKYVVTLFCSRRYGFYFINAYLLNFLITIISLTNFSIEIRRPQNRLSGTFTLILTSISFKWVTNRSLPAVSYMTSLDKYQIVNILYMCTLCVWHAAVATLDETSLRTRYDRISLLCFSILFILIHIFFTISLYLDYKDIKKLDILEYEYKKFTVNNSFTV
ncbi:unnamed protein product [Brachionus calyciflorus]|uniref:Uncharacterized protein n=1 Tax=Brachionus calyciflorus TaxID=104777 RepID=A0A814BRZ0_9BILA|nr:unnamed protein product [Brachionus calyciflorus]